jgi:ABC-type transporter Mla subunit MlaD
MAQSETTFLLMAIAVVISSISLLTSALASIGLFRAVRRLEAKVEPLVPEALGALADMRHTLQATVTQVRELSDRAKDVLDQSQTQVEHFSAAREEVTHRLRVQAERIELVLEDSLSRFQEVVHTLHSGVMRPVREVNGVVSGIRTAFSAYLSGRRPSVAQATSDEEMFI